MAARGAPDPYEVPLSDDDEPSQPSRRPRPRARLPFAQRLELSRKTAWEAVNEAYPIIRQRQTTPPSASSLAPLLEKTARRQPVLRLGAVFNLPSNSSSRNRNMRAALEQVAGAMPPTACLRCQDNKNPWVMCIRMGAEDCCAGCRYNGNEKKCVFLSETDPFDDPVVRAAFTGPLNASFKSTCEEMTMDQRASAVKHIENEMAALAEKKRVLEEVQDEKADVGVRSFASFTNEGVDGGAGDDDDLDLEEIRGFLR